MSIVLLKGKDTKAFYLLFFLFFIFFLFLCLIAKKKKRGIRTSLYALGTSFGAISLGFSSLL